MAIDNIFQEDGSSSMDNGLNQAANLGGIGDVVQGAERFVGNALDKFREKRDERRAIKSFDDEVNNQLNVDSFTPSEDDRDPLSAAQRINLSGRGVIDDVTQADVQRGGGVQQVGTQSGSIIGSQPIFVSKQSALPISLFEKRKKAIVDAAAKKNKAISDYLKIPDNVDPMYDRKITDEFVRLSDELASYPDIDLTDYSDPRVREFMEKRARVESLSRVFDKESGVVSRARAIMDEVKTSGGDFVMDSQAYKDAQDLLLGRYSEQDLINDPKAYQKLLDVAGRIEAESSAVNIFKTNIKPNIEKNLSSWVEGSDINTLGALGVEEVTEKFMDDKRLNDFVDEVTEGLNFSDARLNQVKKIAAKAYASEVVKKFKTIQTGQSSKTTRDAPKEGEDFYNLNAQSDSQGNQKFSYNTEGYLKKETIDSEYAMMRVSDGKGGTILKAIPSGLSVIGTTGDTVSYTDSQLITDLGQVIAGTDLSSIGDELTNSSVELNKAKDSGDEDAVNKAQASYDNALSRYTTAANEVIDGKFDQRLKDRNFTRVTLNKAYLSNNETLAKYEELKRKLSDTELLIESASTQVKKKAEVDRDKYIEQLQVIESSPDFIAKGSVIEVPSSQVRGLNSKLRDLNKRIGYQNREDFFNNSNLTKEESSRLDSYFHDEYLKSIGRKPSSTPKPTEDKKTEEKPKPTEEKEVTSGESKTVTGKSGRSWSVSKD